MTKNSLVASYTPYQSNNLACNNKRTMFVPSPWLFVGNLYFFYLFHTDTILIESKYLK